MEVKDAPLCHALSVPSFFDYLRDDQQAGQNFNMMLQGYAAEKGSWTDIYPAARLIEDLEAGSPIVVDVGGGIGHDLDHFRVKFPKESNGQLILQDQDHVLAEARNLHEGIQKMPHDFFTEQPVKGRSLSIFNPLCASVATLGT